MVYLLLLAGFVLLIKGADIFVDGSSSIAKIFRVPSIIIGLTIVALGTSAPELAVSIAAAAKGQNEIALSNVLGSNIFNLLVVVGLCALLKVLIPAKDIIYRDLPISILCAAAVFVTALGGRISRLEGILFLLGGVSYITLLVIQTKKHQKQEVAKQKNSEEEQMGTGRSLVYILVGIAGIVFGGNLVVDSAKEIAATFGLSETLIGLTIVACGTSLPELVTSVVAAKKGENELALGNVIGSNILNILIVLGLSAAISPFETTEFALWDLGILIGISVLFALLVLFKKKVSKIPGLVMILSYVAYTVYIILR